MNGTRNRFLVRGISLAKFCNDVFNRYSIFELIFNKTSNPSNFLGHFKGYWNFLSNPAWNRSSRIIYRFNIDVITINVDNFPWTSSNNEFSSRLPEFGDESLVKDSDCSIGCFVYNKILLHFWNHREIFKVVFIHCLGSSRFYCKHVVEGDPRQPREAGVHIC